MFGLVSKKKLLAAQRSNSELKVIVNDLTEKLDRAERRNDSLEGSLQRVNRENSDLSTKAIKDNVELFYAGKEIARLENEVFKNSRDGIIQEVRKHLLKEIRKDKEDFAWAKFAAIGATKIKEPITVEGENGVDILQYAIIERILESLEKTMEEKLKEVAASL